jgi:hypothetical protein
MEKATHFGLELLALIVEVTHDTEGRLCLVLEEGVVQNLVVDVQLAHFGLHLVLLLLPKLLILFLRNRQPDSVKGNANRSSISM